jgi:hypothetical protein
MPHSSGIPCVILAALCATAHVACTEESGEMTERLEAADTIEWVADGVWSSLIAVDTGEKLGGCAVGDVDPTKPGNEIVAVGESGAVHLVAWEDKAWTHQIIGRAPGEMVQCVLGDVDANRPGLEIVVVGIAEGGEDDGGPGAAHVLFMDEGEWIMKEFHRSSALLHAACVAELDGTQGPEVLLAGFSGEAVIMDLTDDGWVAVPAGGLPGAAKNAVEFQDGVAVACADGSLVMVRREGDGYETSVIGQAPGGNARMATDGDGRLLVARDDGVLGLYVDGIRSDIYEESAKLRGAVLGNVDPTRPGIEAVTGGYDKTITVLSPDGDDWDGTEIFEDTDRLHHLAAGHIGTLGSTIFVVACGYSGRIIVLRRTPGA